MSLKEYLHAQPGVDPCREAPTTSITYAPECDS